MPLVPKPRRIFFGWWIVAASFLVSMYASGVISYGFTTVFEPISDELGWSYTQISLAASLRGFESGLLSPVAGLIVDRWGPRKVIFTGGLITSLGFFLLGRTSSLGMFYAAFVLMATGTSSFMTVLMTVVVTWFRRRLGLASGIAICGFGAGGLLVPVVAGLVDTHGWRETMTILSVSALAVLLPLSLVFRRKPEEYGYLPDGDTAEQVSPGKIARTESAGIQVTARQAIRSSTFWRIALAIGCMNVVLTAASTHIMPYLSSVGIARSLSSIAAAAIPVMSIGGRLSFGWLGDRFDRRRLAAAALGITGLGVFIFGYTTNAYAWLLIPFIILFGIGFGGVIAVRPPLVREYFGLRSFGAVFGMVMSINSASGVAGPLLAGWVYDTRGSYHLIWFAFAGLLIAALVAVLTVSKPESRSKASGKDPA